MRKTPSSRCATLQNPPGCGLHHRGNLTELIELGYDIDTKAANPAVVQALQERVTAETPWTPVGKNAEMVSWPGYQIHDCPYPLLVAWSAFTRPKACCMRC